MNISYPETTADYDEEFVYRLAVSVFCMEEIKSFLENLNLLAFNKPRLCFVKSNSCITHFLTEAINVQIIYFFIGIYIERVQNDKQRSSKFREHLQAALKKHIQYVEKKSH